MGDVRLDDGPAGSVFGPVLAEHVALAKASFACVFIESLGV